ncbi:gamma-glutamyltransferase family protein [Phreatobacter stygius]|uniref:Gamma-glutamyltransferase family protein n=1 Tax=Phreatobacter stygius TaxID=1940610 RepID=A0A4D7BB27_9HYPH|nr:gamma-glutamyltransferase family protein [Phreatobacter stygius]QCI65312.1 gamma-glutamyltransferase family protein [Phreatobacter stygius]
MDWSFPYPSTRLPVFGDACVATSQPLAAQAGLAMLARGGNAIDAAVATAIALTVVEPTMNGLGSDLFAIVWDGTRLHGLNASGRAPLRLERRRFAHAAAMPLTGWDTVMTPGAVSGWLALSRAFGRLPFADLLEPAIRYAADGFLVPVVVARHWQMQASWFDGQPGFADSFLPGGRAPRPGERFRHAGLATTLERIAASDGRDFYEGRLAEAMAAFAAAHDAPLGAADLAAHEVAWVAPISQRYRGAVVHEPPPNGQGIAALAALGILGHFDLARFAPDDPERLHLMIEATRLALRDLADHVGDPRSMTLTPADLLAPSRLAEAAGAIDLARTMDLGHETGRAQGTVYLASADRDGLMASVIQSNFRGFGSGVVVPGTGIALNNRGSGFCLTPGHPNEAGAGKRPLNTIIPGFMTRLADGAPQAAFGVMGGTMQAQGHVQLVSRMIDHGENPQAAIDAPRWRIAGDGTVMVEAGLPAATATALAGKGHRLVAMPGWSHEAGAAQLIMRLGEAGAGYVAATESRRDGLVAAL